MYQHTHVGMSMQQVLIYHIAQIIGRVQPWQIWRITGGSPNFTIPILTMSRDINKESKHAEIRQNFNHQKLLMRNLPKFSSAKHLWYTVFTDHYITLAYIL